MTVGVKKIFVDGIMHLGDMIMTASVFPVLKKAYPNAEVTYLASANLAFVAEALEGVDRVVPYAYQSKGGYWDVYRMGKKLEKEHFDIGISLDPRERVTFMKWFARIPIRISLEQALGWKLGWEKWFYTHDLSFEQEWNWRRHRMGESFQVLMRKFVQDKDSQFIIPEFKKSSEEVMKSVKQMMRIYPESKLKIAFCVETINRDKDWPAEKFSIIADWLIETYKASIIMTGVASHSAKVQEIISSMKYKNFVINMVGKTSFLELIALFRQTDMVLTLDTGTTHIASAAGCPVVTIFSHGSPEIYQGAGEKTRAVSAHLPCSGKHICIGPAKCTKRDCIDAVTVEMVKKEISSLMGTI